MSQNSNPETDDGGEESRIQSLEERDRRMDSMEAKIDQILGIHSGKPPAAQQDTDTGVAAEVRRQLDERDQRTAASRQQADKDAADADLRKQVQDMQEKLPQAPVRKIEQIMGWR